MNSYKQPVLTCVELWLNTLKIPLKARHPDEQ